MEPILGGHQTMQIYGNFGGFAHENALIALFGLVSYNDPCNRFEIFQTCVARPTWTHITTTTSPVSSWVNPFKGILGIGKCASWVSFPVNAGEVCGFTCIHIKNSSSCQGLQCLIAKSCWFLHFETTFQHISTQLWEIWGGVVSMCMVFPLQQ